MAGRVGCERRTEASDQLPVELFRKRFEIARVGDVVAEQELPRPFVADLPLMPEANGLPPVEPYDVLVPIDAQFLLDGLKTASESKTPCGEAEVKMRLSKIQSRKFRLEIRDIESTPEKSHKQVSLIQFIVQAILRQIFPVHKTGHAAVAVEPDHCDMSDAGGHTGSFNVQIEDTVAKRVKQTPVFARLETRGEILCMTGVQV